LSAKEHTFCSPSATIWSLTVQDRERHSAQAWTEKAGLHRVGQTESIAQEPAQSIADPPVSSIRLMLFSKPVSSIRLIHF